MSYDPDTMRRGRDILVEAADEGDADAMCFLARTFFGEHYVWSGADFPESDARGKKLLMSSIEKGSAAGIMCAMRTGMWEDNMLERTPYSSLSDVFDSVLIEADEGDTFCRYLIANVYFWGDWVLFFPEHAKQFYHGDEFDEDAYNAFAYPFAAHYYELSFDGDLSMGFGNYRSIAQSGLTNVTMEKVAERLHDLALSGCPVCKCEYGKYIEDTGGKPAEAFNMYREAYEAGDKESAYNLATCYGRGYGTQKDLDRAYELYQAAAEAGMGNAYFQLANFYFEGRGNVAVDPEQAMRWLRRSYSFDSNWRAAAEMGVLYQNGYGTVSPDDEVAFHYLHRVEASGHIDELWETVAGPVLTALGTAYAFGRGIAQDIDKGTQYLDRAISLGFEPAKPLRKKFIKTIFGWYQRK